MASEPQAVLDHGDELEEVKLAYEEAAAAGNPPSPEELLARHPHLAAQLRAYLDARVRLAPLLESLLPPAPFVPESFGDYQLLGKPTRGGMGVVYRARQVSLNRVVALKMIRDWEQATPEDLERFRREAGNVANLDHPHIVPIYEVGEHAGRPFFSMKLIEGGNLTQHRRCFAGRPRAIAALVETVARAVHYAHQRGILHRDLKPGNILLASPHDAPAPAAAPASTTSDGAADGQRTLPSPRPAPTVRGREAVLATEGFVPYVTDFGLAQRIDAPDSLSPTGTPVGTPSYMAPEQARPEKVLTTAVDVYGLGAILYELLTERPPFLGATVMDILRQVLDEEPARPRSVNPEVDHDLEVICLKCLEKEPGRRYGSALEVADDLRRFAEGRPIRARRSGWPERAVKWARRRPAVAALTALAVLLALVGAGAFVWQLWQTEEAWKKAEEQAYIKGVNLAKEYLARGQYDAADEQLASCPARFRGWEWHCFKRLCRREGVVLRGHEGQVVAVQYSRDGKFLATAGQGRRDNVKLWDPATGKLLRSLESHARFANAVCFSGRDGGLLLSAGEDQVVRVWKVVTGEDLGTLKTRGSLLAASRDGQRVAVAGNNTVVTVFDVVEDGALFREVWHKELQPMKGDGAAKPMIQSIALSPDGRYLAVGGFHKLVKAWDLRADQELPAFVPPWTVDMAKVWAVTFSPDGKYLAAGSAQPIIWEMEHDPLKAATRWCRFFSGTGGQRCGALAFSHDGKLLAATYRDQVRVWDTDRGTIVLTPRKALGHNPALAFSPNGKALALGRGKDVAIEPLDPAPGFGSRILAGHHSRDVSALAFGPDGLLASRAADEVILWDVFGDRPARTVKLGAEVAAGANLALTPDGGRVVSPCKEGLKAWDFASGKEGKALAIAAGGARYAAFSDDGTRLATTDGGNQITLWEWPAGDRLRSFGGDTGEIKALAFRPHSRQLVSCGTGGIVRLWDAETGSVVATFCRHNDAVTGVTFSRDGKRMATSGADLKVRLWDVDSGRERAVLSGHAAQVNAVAYSPDGRRLASASEDGTVKLWDGATGQAILTFDGFDGPAAAVAFSPDGDLLAASCRDGTVRVWDGRPVE
jgi:WD40 repeat protein